VSLSIVKEKEYPLLSRNRITFMWEAEGPTPSRIELLKEIAKMSKAKEDLVVIRHIYPQVGNSKAKIIAHIYTDKKKLEFFENKSLVAKHTPKEKKKKEE
jgi:ribosomal protein S24E